jgi:hypothetical protein
MKKTHFFILAAITLLVTGCDIGGIRGNGHLTTEQRTIGEFSEVRADGAFEIEWRSGAPALSVTTDENLLRYIDNKISGNTLRLHSRERIWPRHKIKVVVSSTTLRGADLSGACHLDVKQISGEKFFLRSAGATHINLAGNVDELIADMSGATKLSAEALQTKTAELSGSGASHLDVTVSEALRVSISGAGKVTYAGNPKTLEKHISGAGSVRQRN